MRVGEEPREYLQTPAPPLFGEDFIAPTEAQKEVIQTECGLKLMKALGHNMIVVTALKQLPAKGLVRLTQLFKRNPAHQTLPVDMEDW